jgi:hypothetical protein
MATFKIGVYEEQSGFVYIKAESKYEAREKVQEILNEYGIEGFLMNNRDKEIELMDIEHRECNLI